MNPTNCSVLPILVLLAGSALAQEDPRPVLAAGDDGAFGAVNAVAAVRFEAGGARIVPHGGDGVQLRLVAARRGASEVRRAAVGPARVTEHRVEYRHDGVVERYELTARGFEQSFVLERRPVGDGDLVLTVEVVGAAATVARAAEHAAIELVPPAGPAVRYGAAFAFERGGERVPLATSSDGRGHVELVVPAALLERVRYPLVVDPLVEPVFVVAPSGGLPQRAGDVARSDLYDTYMAVWVQPWNGNDRIYMRSFWADGTPRIAPTMVGGSLAGSSRPAVADVAGSFAIAWECAGAIHGRVVGAAGDTITFAETFTFPGVGGRDQRPAIAGNEGGSFILGWDHTPPGAQSPVEIRVQRISLPSPTGTSLVFGPVRTLTSVASGGHVEDLALPRSALRRNDSTGEWLEARAVWSRWYNSPAPGDFDLHTASFRIRGAALGGSFQVLDGPESVVGAAAIGPSEAHGDIAVIADASVDPGEVLYCAVWDVGGNVRAQRFDPLVAVGATIDVEAGAEVATLPSIGAGACEFSVVYGYQSMAGVSQVRAARLLRDGTVAVANVAVDGVAGGSSFAAPRLSSRPVRNSTTDRTNRCFVVYDRAPSAAPSAAEVRVAVWEPVGYSLSPFGTACPGPLGEMPTIGTTGEAYAGATNFAVTLDDAPPSTIAALLISDVFVSVPVPGAPGCSAYLGLPVLVALPSVTLLGSTSRTIGLPCGIPSGAALAMQWIVYTPGHNAFGWITSDDVDVYWSHF